MTNAEIKAFIEHLMKQTIARIQASKGDEIYNKDVKVMQAHRIIKDPKESPVTEAFLEQRRQTIAKEMAHDVQQLAAESVLERLQKMLGDGVFSVEQIDRKSTRLPVT